LFTKITKKITYPVLKWKLCYFKKTITLWTYIPKKIYFKPFKKKVYEASDKKENDRAFWSSVSLGGGTVSLVAGAVGAAVTFVQTGSVSGWTYLSAASGVISLMTGDYESLDHYLRHTDYTNFRDIAINTEVKFV